MDLIGKGIGDFSSLGVLESIGEDKARIRLSTPHSVYLSDDTVPKLAITELVLASKNGIIFSKELSKRVKHALGFISQEAKNHSTKTGLDLFLSKGNAVFLGKGFFLILSEIGTRSLITKQEKKSPNISYLKKIALDIYPEPEIEV